MLPCTGTWPNSANGVSRDGEQPVAQRNVQRPVGCIQPGIGRDRERIAGQQIGIGSRQVQAGHLAVQPKLTRVAGDVGGEPVDPDAGPGQRVDAKSAGGIRAQERAADVRVDLDRLPADVRPRLHGGRAGRHRQIGGVLFEIERAANGGMQLPGGQSHAGASRPCAGSSTCSLARSRVASAVPVTV